MASVDTDAEYVRQQLAIKQKQYEEKRMKESEESAKKSRESSPVQPMASLTMIPYLNDEGMISNVSADPTVKATVYAIFNSEEKLCYIGISRQVIQSLRLHLARCPTQTYWIKLQHITTPSRSLLELIKKEWIEENGAVPPGNSSPEEQAKWESPLDVKPLMTDDDREQLKNVRETKGREDMKMKEIARRFEYEIADVLEGRGVKEELRFDPKLKAKGLLDLHQPKPKDEIPKTK
eukprot:CAMPEP_0171475804 /NCGR_PEP_ID=MMETSP0946-20130122/3212_1 /TAXON_ID=109269 /ORGANISM="Vaucheria litorea, Strain CCMP2940" /LENGTH=234 /DNA_ID=CAMNT_0012005943 /DNA_START=114 /DNA_END=815 /DNA_ORIENTATION=+